MTSGLWSCVREPPHLPRPRPCPAPAQPGPLGQMAPRPHSPLYLALLRGPRTARPGSEEPAWRWAVPRRPLLGPRPGSHMRGRLRPGYLTRASRIWDPQLPAPQQPPHKSYSRTLSSAPPGLLGGGPAPSCSGALNTSGGRHRARLLAPMTSWKLEALSWNNFQQVKIKQAPSLR